jgi:hypothetical protein
MSDGPRSKRSVKKKRDAVAQTSPPRPPSPSGERGEEEVKGRRPGWTVPHPEVLPRPTFWPAGLAFAVTFMLWGIVTSPIITAVGALLLVVSLSGWIGDIRNERAH